MEAHPSFRHELSGELTLRPSAEALAVEREHLSRVGSGPPLQVQDSVAVWTEARRRVAAAGGDPRNEQQVAGESAIQFGQYRGKSFRWILENDAGYAVMVLAGHQKKRESETRTHSALTNNKEMFLNYARSFPELYEAIKQQCERDIQTEEECFEPADSEQMACAVDVDVQAPPPRTPPVLVNLPRSRRKAADKKKEETPLAAFEGPVLPVSWKKSLPKEQHEWIGRTLFKRDRAGKAVLKDDLQMWWYPPPPVHHEPPGSPDAFFTRPFCLWMPYRMWAFKPLCMQPNCKQAGQHLTACGLYKTVRRVLDIDGWYYMATEYLECRRCQKKVASWSQDILEQLDPVDRFRFPAILTYRLSCDIKVVRLMRERSLGNSVSMLCNQLKEQHSEAWIVSTLQYLAVCKKFHDSGAELQHVAQPPPMVPVPSPHWLLIVHAKDIGTRMSEMKARVTSIFGTVLKMDSTKKVTKKLAGVAAGRAAWVTNVGNEHGQVLMSVLTADEGKGLLPMATGIMHRYRDAGVPPPKVLYVNRYCCSAAGESRASAMFFEWKEMVVRLDVCHLIQRFAGGVTTESHKVYGLFMSKLSACIFKWDTADVSRLREATRVELEQKQGLVGLTEDKLNAKLTEKLLVKHCRRYTRGSQETEELISQLLARFRDVTDTRGIPLLDAKRMDTIWDTQRQHINCIQDPPGLQLYTKIGQLTIGGIIVPVYRCARGTSSLGSFHVHLDRFIPGTSANAKNFQAYLLEGLVRWNEDRAAAATDKQEPVQRCYSGEMQHSLNQLSQQLLGRSLVEDYTKPGEYTGNYHGELIGVEFSQPFKEMREDISHDPDSPDDTLDTTPDWEDEEVWYSCAEDRDSTIAPLSVAEDTPMDMLLHSPSTSGVNDHMTQELTGLSKKIRLQNPSLTTATPVLEPEQILPRAEHPGLLPPAPLPPALLAPLPPSSQSVSTSPPVAHHSENTVQPQKAWSRTTKWRRRKSAEAMAKQQGLPVHPRFTYIQYTCSLCGKPKTKEFGHSRMGNRFFCSTAEGKTVDEWRAEIEEKH